jgi:ribulose 1,5-bisphosphate synthetase/thiazole synthase
MRLLVSLACLSLSLAVAADAHSTRSTILTRAEQAAEIYDYIVVGGGQSGLTVADRLTEDEQNTVLAVEYGELSMHGASVATYCLY